MRLSAALRLSALSLLTLAAPAWAQQPPAHAPADASDASAAVAGAHVRVTARIVVVDRDALARAGLDYVVVGHDRVRVTATGRAAGRAGGRGGGIGVGIHGVTAFLEAARERRWVRSESTQQVLVMSGGEGMVASTDLAVGRHAARTRGPSLAVLPSVLPDGRVHLRVSARVEDTVRYAWGYGIDGSPAAVETEVVAGDGEELLLASSSAVRSSREARLLGWSESEQGRDVLVSLTARVVPR